MNDAGREILPSDGPAARASDGYLEQMMFRVPAERVGEASELVAAALFLASDGSYITGVLLLPVDGGMLAT